MRANDKKRLPNSIVTFLFLFILFIFTVPMRLFYITYFGIDFMFLIPIIQIITAIILFFILLARNTSTIKSCYAVLIIWLIYVSSSLVLNMNENIFRDFAKVVINVFGVVTAMQLLIEIDRKKFLFSLYLLFFTYLIFTLFENTFSYTVDTTNDFERGTLFVGGRTRIPDFSIPLICVSLLYSLMVKQKLLTIYSCSAFILSFYLIIIRYNIATGTVGLLIFVLLLIIFDYNKSMRNIKVSLLIIFFVLTNVAILLYSIQNVFGFFIETILGKDLTLTYRTFIWETALPQIYDNFFLGVGRNNGIIGFVVGKGFLEAHNNMLQLLFDFGFVGFSLYMYYLNECCKPLNNYSNIREKGIILAALITFFVMSTTEIYFNKSSFYVIPILAANISLFKERSKDDQ
ncbi:MAG: O-antigen ligase family protein [Oscillospiraceae bacterium]|nr:O-antigen ligase family protein [Oscillospiraceae bacterium]